MQRPTVLILFGGESSEHDVSVASARNVYAAIDDAKFDVLLSYIDSQGKWWLVEEIDQDCITSDGQELLPVLGGRSFVTRSEERVVTPDVLLPILHGKNGEDGSVQGLAQLLHIPIVGCDVLASALCMDKMRTKLILGNAGHLGIKTAEWVSFNDQATFREELDQLIADSSRGRSSLTEQLGGGSWFVKPSRGGSSVGVSKVEAVDGLEDAIAAAFLHDTTVLVERAITGRELEIAVLGNPPQHRASAVGEVVLGETFYSYDEKYAAHSTSHVQIPAGLSDELSNMIRERAQYAYEVLGCTGLARIDFFLTDELELYLNEVNTMPGFTNTSMYPKLWQHSGLNYSDLIAQLINLALDATIEPEVKGDS